MESSDTVPIIMGVYVYGCRDTKLLRLLSCHPVTRLYAEVRFKLDSLYTLVVPYLTFYVTQIQVTEAEAPSTVFFCQCEQRCSNLFIFILWLFRLNIIIQILDLFFKIIRWIIRQRIRYLNWFYFTPNSMISEIFLII